MKQILGFLLLAIKWLSKSTFQIKNQPEDHKYVILDDITKSIELAYYHWLFLSQKHWVIISGKNNKKRHETLFTLHKKLQDLIKDYPELNGFDIRQGNPFFELVSLKALSRADLIEKHGQKVLCLEVELLKRLVVTIITYNFFKKHKERAGELFIDAESSMRVLVEDKKLPGRFSWNTFVAKEEQDKDEHEIDPSYLDLYSGLSSGEVDQKEDSSSENDESENGFDEDTTTPKQ